MVVCLIFFLTLFYVPDISRSSSLILSLPPYPLLLALPFPSYVSLLEVNDIIIFNYYHIYF